jgi:hypothetical protein
MGQGTATSSRRTKNAVAETLRAAQATEERSSAHIRSPLRSSTPPTASATTTSPSRRRHSRFRRRLCIRRWCLHCDSYSSRKYETRYRFERYCVAAPAGGVSTAAFVWGVLRALAFADTEGESIGGMELQFRRTCRGCRDYPFARRCREQAPLRNCQAAEGERVACRQSTNVCGVGA